MTENDNLLDQFFSQAAQESETDMSGYAADWMLMQGLLLNNPINIGKPGGWNPGIFYTIVTAVAGTLLVLTFTTINKEKPFKSDNKLQVDTPVIKKTDPTIPDPFPNSSNQKNEAMMVPTDSINDNRQIEKKIPITKVPANNGFEIQRESSLPRNADTLPVLKLEERSASHNVELRVLNESQHTGKREKFDFDTVIAFDKKNIDSVRKPNAQFRKKTTAGAIRPDTSTRPKKDSL